MLGEREQFFLKKLTELYLKEGQPIGSRTLSRLPDITVSPATIRNVMSDLEEMGLITSPHTSAGRVPTSQGLRLYVEQFLVCQPVSREYVTALGESLQQAGDVEETVERASALLSELTGLVSVVMLPDRSREKISHVALVPLSEKRVLVVLVFDNQQAENRFIELDVPLSADQLARMAAFFNDTLVGVSLREAREQLLQRMRALQNELNTAMTQLLEGAQGALDAHVSGKPAVRVAGEHHLLEYRELSDTSKLRALFEEFEAQRNMLHLLDRSLQARGLQIFIGRETGIDVYESCSVVTHSYEMGEEMVGVLGVIGPQRMPYDRVIPMVDITARMLDSILKKQCPAPLKG